MPRPIFISPEINSRLDAIELDIKKARILRKALLSPAVSELYAAICLISPYTHIWHSTSSQSIYLSLTIGVPGFTITAAPELFHALEHISALTGVDPTSEGFPQMGTQAYLFDFTLSRVKTQITVYAALQEGSKACQRVVVATERVTRLVEQEVDEPVYKFVC